MFDSSVNAWTTSVPENAGRYLVVECDTEYNEHTGTHIDHFRPEERQLSFISTYQVHPSDAGSDSDEAGSDSSFDSTLTIGYWRPELEDQEPRIEEVDE